MTADILEQATTTPASHDQPDELHYYCCDPDIAMCGANITNCEDLGYTDTSRYDECPMCAHVDDTGLPCPVPGCRGDRTRRIVRAVSRWITGGAA
jgi:hypothetical protein